MKKDKIPYEKVYQAFNKAGINYAVCGGAAVIIFGYARTSVDLDLVVELTKSNLEKIYDNLLKLGYNPNIPIKKEEFCDPEKLKSLEREKNMKVVSFCNSQNPFEIVDIGVNLPMINEILKNKKIIKAEDIHIPLISIDNLIKMKEDLARPKDIDDVYNLKEIKNEKGKS